MKLDRCSDVDLILPCYNPAVDWDLRVVTHFESVQRCFPGVNFHLYVVSDGSRRGFEPEVVARFRAALPNVTIIDYQPNRGKGYALREAAKCCESPYVMYTDYDFPYTQDSFNKVLESLVSGADVVVAVRDKQYQKNLPPFRRTLSRLSHWCNALVLRLPIKDTQGGMKGFSCKGRQIFLTTRIDSFLFDTEFIYKARKAGLRVEAVEARIKEGLSITNMGLRVMWKEGLNFLAIVFHKN